MGRSDASVFITNLLQQAQPRVPRGELCHRALGGEVFSRQSAGGDVENIRLLGKTDKAKRGTRIVLAEINFETGI